mmetsp:Transcript_32265/g.23820  ORF Transcript_32265/g.23820 Transcript_32265/m.23820 type:complete len:112 (+) Transcript_32265:256-591(+)
MATFQYLGPFIASYIDIEPNPILIDYYIDIVKENKSDSADNDISYHCAFNFPAVLYTLGPSAWPKLFSTYQTLLFDSRWKVRRTLAYSFHEVAKILGPDAAAGKEMMDVLQ